MEINSGVHLVILTCDKYFDTLPAVVESTKNILDPIISKTIISPTYIHVSGFKTVLDHQFWKLLDPEFKNKRLYDNTWYRQQIFKLAVDQLGLNGNILILDGDVLIVKPSQFIENEKFNFYMCAEHHEPYFYGNEALIGRKQAALYSFISEAMVFHSEILVSLRNYICSYTKNPVWIDSIENVFSDTLDRKPSNCVLSEYELYGNFVLEWYNDLINKLVEPYLGPEFYPRMNVIDWIGKSGKEIYDEVKSRSVYYFQSIILVSSKWSGIRESNPSRQLGRLS